MVFESGMSTDQDTLADFCQSLKAIQARHSSVVQTMAQGVLELRGSHTVDNKTEMAIQYFLDRFYMSRISIRMLIHQVRRHTQHTNLYKSHLQHTLLFEPGADKDTRRIGMIDPNCRVKSVIMEAYQNTAFLCEEYYDYAPDFKIIGRCNLELG